MSRILLFEPDADVCAVAAVSLIGAGYEAVIVTDAEGAHRAIAEGGVVAALVEVSLSDETGWEVASVARSHGLPVVVCTVHAAEPVVARRSRAAGAVLLEKTGNPLDLLILSELTEAAAAGR